MSERIWFTTKKRSGDVKPLKPTFLPLTMGAVKIENKMFTFLFGKNYEKEVNHGVYEKSKIH